jgi:hypothetical protein
MATGDKSGCKLSLPPFSSFVLAYGSCTGKSSVHCSSSVGTSSGLRSSCSSSNTFCESHCACPRTNCSSVMMPSTGSVHKSLNESPISFTNSFFFFNDIRKKPIASMKSSMIPSHTATMAMVRLRRTPTESSPSRGRQHPSYLLDLRSPLITHDRLCPREPGGSRC